jgi:protein-L-isoaspartate(D-aspartate) O-methyltransferase
VASGRASIDEVRHSYSRLMVAASKSDDPRSGPISGLVPREAFLPPGPWRQNGRYFATPNADPVHLHKNVLVALVARKGISSGEPSPHAAWIGAVAPKSGEAVSARVWGITPPFHRCWYNPAATSKLRNRG